MRSWKAALLGLAALAYGRAVVARNRTLRPPAVRDAAGRPFPTSSFRYSDGHEVGLIDVGEGTPTLWVPGADGVKETWRYQLPFFARRFRAIAPDLRAAFAPLDTFDRFVDDLAELVDSLGTGPVVLLGQSLGGAIAMRFAYRFPRRVRGLVLCNTLARVSYEHLGFNRTALVPVAAAATRYLPTRAAEGLARRVWSPRAVWVFDDSPGRDALIEYVLFSGSRTVPPRVSARRVALLERTDLRPSLTAITSPTLVVKGPLDSYCPPAWALEIAGLIPGSRYLEIPGTGHCSHISAPGAFNQAVLRWLEERGTEATGTVGGAERADEAREPGELEEEPMRSDAAEAGR